MSFSSEVKKELTSLPASKTSLLALIRMNGSLGISGQLTLSIQTENAAIAKYIYQMLQDFYGVKGEIRVHQKTTLSKNRVYNVYLDENVNQLLDELQLADSLMLETGLPASVKADRNLQPDYLRGAFLSNGSIHNPDSGEYQLSISNVYQEHAEELQELFQAFGMNAKVIARKNRFILYLTKAEEIIDFLSLIGSHQARFKFEEAKMMREMRGLANRRSNFEAANIGKTVSAAQEAIEAIQFLKEKQALVKLSPQLVEIAELRLKHPESSLKELGELLEKPVGKSGVNHRLRKLIEAAKELRN